MGKHLECAMGVTAQLDVVMQYSIHVPLVLFCVSPRRLGLWRGPVVCLDDAAKPGNAFALPVPEMAVAPVVFIAILAQMFGACKGENEQVTGFGR